MIGDIAAAVLIVTGAVFFVIGTTGLLRLPDLYSRIHVCTKSDTMGGCSILLGLAVYGGFSAASLKLLLVAFFLLLSSATCGHAIGRSAYIRGLAAWRKKEGGEAQ